VTAVSSAPRVVALVRGRHRKASESGFRPRAVFNLLALLAVAWLVWPASLGGRIGLAVVSGPSMEPTQRIGDIAFTWRTEPAIGDVVLFQIPEGPAQGRPVIHRIVGGDAGGWITQGDNNAHPDEWNPTSADVLGRTLFTVRGGGRVVWAIGSPLAVAMLAGTAVALWMWPVPESRRGRHLVRPPIG
jgi:signal peptidase